MNEEKKKTAQHPDHTCQIVALNRIVGQIEAIKKMIEDRKYCPQIIQQIKAARGGLVSAEIKILTCHISNCVTEAIQSGDEISIEEKSKEVAMYIKGLVV